MGSDPAPFFANLFLHHYESEWLGTIKNQEYHCAHKFSNAFRFIDDLIVINDSNEFLRSHPEIYPEELELKRENDNEKEATFLDLHINIDPDGKIKTKLYDKRNYYNFFIVRLPHKSSNLPSRMFYSIISAELLRICSATTEFQDFILTSKTMTDRMNKQGACKQGLVHIINKHRHDIEFNKYNRLTNVIASTLIN